MAVLIDREISGLVSGGSLISSNYREGNLTPNGYDVTVESVRKDGDDADSADCDIPPGKVFWISTEEVFNMPPGIGGQIWIRSSFARKGVFGSFGFIDAGFRGTLTLAFFNGSSSPLKLKKGDTIAQITFVRLGGDAGSTYDRRSGNYQGQKGIRL